MFHFFIMFQLYLHICKFFLCFLTARENSCFSCFIKLLIDWLEILNSFEPFSVFFLNPDFLLFFPPFIKFVHFFLKLFLIFENQLIDCLNFLGFFLLLFLINLWCWGHSHFLLLVFRYGFCNGLSSGTHMLSWRACMRRSVWDEVFFECLGRKWCVWLKFCFEDFHRFYIVLS